MNISQLLDDITLHENDLSEEAKTRFNYHVEILHGFDIHRRNIRLDADLTRMGRHLLLSRIDTLHKTCKQVLNYMAENEQVFANALPPKGPLVICGLPRTGTTLLYNLLACDPDARAPLFTEMCVECVPPIARSNLVEHERRESIGYFVQGGSSSAEKVTQVLASHPKFPIEEDHHILQQTSVLALYMIVNSSDQSDPAAWLHEGMNKNFAYEYHEVFLRMLNSVDTPRSHWLLKSFMHIFYLDKLLRQYPQALLVMTHRRLDKVFPSYCRLVWAYDNYISDLRNENVRKKLTERSIYFLDTMIERMVEFRIRQNHENGLIQKNIIDVAYDDLIEEPIATVHRIYDHFGLSWSNEFEVAMKAWLHENPQGKQGRNIYTLEQFGLTRESIEARHMNYINLFLNSSSIEKIEGK